MSENLHNVTQFTNLFRKRWDVLRQKWHSLSATQRRVIGTLGTIVLVGYLGFAALMLGLQCLVLPNVDYYKKDIEEIVSEDLGKKLSIGDIRASWSGIRPKLKLTEVKLYDDDGRLALELPEVTAVVAWRSLLVMDVRLALLEINRPEMFVKRDRDGRLYVAGMLVDTRETDNSERLEWFLRQNQIVIRDGKLRWLDEMRDGAELSLTDVQFRLKNRGRNHRFALMATPPENLSGLVDVRGDFSHPWMGRISDLATWRGELYTRLVQAQLPLWKKYVDFPISLESGEGQLEMWLNLDQGRMIDLTADASVKNVRLRLSKNLPYLQLDYLTGRFATRELPDQNPVSSKNDNDFSGRSRSVSMTDLSLKTVEGLTLEETSVSGSYIPGTETTPEKTDLYIGQLDLGKLVHLMKYLPLTEMERQLIADLSPSGVIKEFKAKWEGRYPDIRSYEVDGAFQNLSLKGQAPDVAKAKKWRVPLGLGETYGIPGFSNLSGRINATPRQGSVHISSKKSAWYLPGYFRNPELDFNVLDMQANWAYIPQKKWQLTINKMAFERDALAGSLEGTYEMALDRETPDAGTIDLKAHIQHLDIGKFGDLVPLHTPKTLYDWLSQALKKGTATDGEVRIKGRLSELHKSLGKVSGKADEALLSAKIKIHQGELDYAPGLYARNGKTPMWPVINEIEGMLTIRNTQLQIHADSAKTSGTHLSDVDVAIPDLFADNLLLTVSGKVEGELQQFIEFVNQTPVLEWIGDLTDETRTTGEAELDLKMQMPLDNLPKTKVQGTLAFDNNNVRLFEDLPELSKVRGKLSFYEAGFQLGTLQADFLGGRTTLSGGTQSNGRFRLTGSGRITAEGVRKNYTSTELQPFLQQVTGSSPFTLLITESAAGADVLVESTMQGLGLNFPQPLGKKVESTRPIQVKRTALQTTGGKQRDELSIRWGDAIGARYERQKLRQGNWTVTQGGVAINRPLIMRPDLMFNVSLHELDVDAWNTLSSKKNTQTENQKAAKYGVVLDQYLYPAHLDIALDELSIMNMKINNLILKGNRYRDHAKLSIQSDQLSGQIDWQTLSRSGGKLSANLTSLNISKLSSDQKGTLFKDNDASEINTLDLVVQNFSLYDKPLGRTEVMAHRVPSSGKGAWKIDKLLVSNPDGKMQASGLWQKKADGAQHTRMQYDVQISNAGKLLNRMGYPDVMKAGKGSLKGAMEWDGTPFDLDLASLDGTMALDVEKGQFLKVDMRAANLLNLLSMQSLPKRLSLDFRDVFSGGFAFDSIKANAQISRGVATTHNFKMLGSNASVLMDGSVNLDKKTQNLHIAVIPDINAGMASLIYGFVNPAIGLGTFLAQMVLREPLMKSLTYEYQLTGTWDNPDFKKVSRSK